MAYFAYVIMALRIAPGHSLFRLITFFSVRQNDTQEESFDPAWEAKNAIEPIG
jgi:hypothetical protein